MEEPPQEPVCDVAEGHERLRDGDPIRDVEGCSVDPKLTYTSAQHESLPVSESSDSATLQQALHRDTTPTRDRVNVEELGGEQDLESLPSSGDTVTESFTHREIRHTGKVSEPIQCPDVPCHIMCFPSDLITHLSTDHLGLYAEQVGLRQTKTLYLDPKAARLNEATCIRLYELKDKITDPQAGLPVIVMAARTRLFDSNDPSGEFLLVWLSSFRLNNIQILGTLSVRSPRADRPDTLTVLTTQLYDIRAPKDMGAVFHSPSTMVLPNPLLQRMTNNGQNFIFVQVLFH